MFYLSYSLFLSSVLEEKILNLCLHEDSLIKEYCLTCYTTYKRKRTTEECKCEERTIKLKFAKIKDYKFTANVIQCFHGNIFIFGYAKNSFIVLNSDYNVPFVDKSVLTTKTEIMVN